MTLALRDAGLVHPGQDIETAKLMDYLAPFSEPARHEVFHYTRDWLRTEFGKVNDPRNPDFAVALQLTIPPEQLFTHRVWLGVVGVLGPARGAGAGGQTSSRACCPASPPHR